MPLGAAVLVLPDGARWLSSIISGAHSSDAGRVLVCGVVGGSGGVGASTLAAGVASAAARRRRSVALVDVDVAGGGLDLLLRAEEVPGWRWSRLRTARGQIGDLRGKVPSIDGIDLISMGRVGESDVGRDAVTAVIASLGRTHEIVVLDIGRDLGAVARTYCRSLQPEWYGRPPVRPECRAPWFGSDRLLPSLRPPSPMPWAFTSGASFRTIGPSSGRATAACHRRALPSVGRPPVTGCSTT
jgi:hypothetical protein